MTIFHTILTLELTVVSLYHRILWKSVCKMLTIQYVHIRDFFKDLTKPSFLER